MPKFPVNSLLSKESSIQSRDALQIWLELGLVGILIVAVAFGAAAERLHRSRLGRLETAAVVGQVTTAVGIACLSFGLWQAWWLVSLVLVAVLTRALMAEGYRPPSRA